ncbi:MAG: cadmium-translocating P-type ATPase [Clostridia bacterium]|nr:cadmium-translocating P-type ATPase [Clostridia bacterium]
MKQKYSVTGMTCAACQANVERRVSKIEGVNKVDVNLLSGSMTAEYDEALTGDAEIIAAVTEIGYGASLYGQNNTKQNNYAENERTGMWLRLIASVIIMIPLMYIAMGHMWGLPMPYMPDIANAVTQMLLAILVIFINRKFFIVGSKALVKLSPNMDTLVMIGSGASFIYGVITLYRMAYGDTSGTHDLYFESAAMILTLVTVGKYLEARSKAKTTSALDKLINLSPKTATVVREDKEVTVLASDIRAGDIIIVKPGEAIAVDGVVLSGNGWVDQSAVTGESIPVEKKEGDDVICATVNKNGSFKFRATRVGEETTISQIIKMVEDAGSSKPPIARLADKISGIFVPIVIAIALVTFIVWTIMGKGVDFSLNLAISVLVISCPCALGLATPVAIMVGTGRAASLGILVKSAEVLEALHSIDTVVLDKTGTVTEGTPRVTDISGDGAELLRLAYSLESKSEHPLGQAVCRYAEEKGITKEEITDFENIPGRGIKAIYQGKKALGGNSAFMSEAGIEMTDIPAYAKEGKTPLIFALDGKVLGVIAVADTIRPDSREAIESFKKQGIDIIMLTGDNSDTAKAIAEKAGIEHIISDVMPGDKESCISRLQAEGKRVAMIGDGINDAPALTRADVGIAIGAGTDIAIDSADIVLMKSALTDAVTAIDLGKAVIRNIKTNLFWAFFYNTLGIPLAAGVLFIPFGIKLDPMIGAAAMSLSSVCVVTNALRLYNFSKTKKKGNKEMTKTLKVDGMMCPRCKAHVEKALMAVEGVAEAVADLDAKTATVTLNTEVATEVLNKAVTDAGYTVL